VVRTGEQSRGPGKGREGPRHDWLCVVLLRELPLPSLGDSGGDGGGAVGAVEARQRRDEVGAKVGDVVGEKTKRWWE
jgi:hypothetical protein